MLEYTLDIEEGSLWLRTTPNEFTRAQPYFCTEAGIFYARGHFFTERDYKDSWILFHTLKGAGLITQGETTVRLGEGESLLMNCRTPQSYRTDPVRGVWTHYWAHIDGSGMNGLEEKLIPEKKISSVTSSRPVLSEFDLLLKNMETTESDTILSISLSIHTILTNLALTKDASVSKNQTLIRRCADYIVSHYNQPLPLPELLETAGMSRSYFMRLFKQYTGTTPYNYALSIRMNKARELLEVTNMTVHEIAMETGFSDDAAFSTRFSAMVGLSPLRYRQNAITRRQVHLIP